MIQGGCPDGTGSGGPGWTINAEFNDREHHEGVLSMARTADPNSAGSQFFICLGRDHCKHLDGSYTAFGKITDGIDVVRTIGAVETDHGDVPRRTGRHAYSHCLIGVARPRILYEDLSQSLDESRPHTCGISSSAAGFHDMTNDATRSGILTGGKVFGRLRLG